MRVDAFDFELPPGPHRAHAGVAARQRADACRRRGRRADGLPRFGPARFPPPRRRAGGQRHQGDRRAARWDPRAGRGGRGHRGDADQAPRRLPLARPRQARQEAFGRRAHPVRRGAREHGLPARRPRRRGGGEGRGRRGHAAVRIHRRRARRGDRARRHGSVAALHRRPARAGREGSRRLSDPVRRARRRGRRADRRASFHARAGRPHGRARRDAASGHAARRGGDLPARESGGHRGPRHAQRMGRARRRDGRGAERRASGRRADRCGRHDLGAHPRERRRRNRPHSSLRRRHRDLHHARLPVPRDRCSHDQFPPATLDAVHAGRAPSAGSRR